jgi:hypothetical protein
MLHRYIAFIALCVIALAPMCACIDPGAAGIEVLTKLSPTLASAFNFYQTQLYSHPVLTKACTSCVGFGLGDALAQWQHAKAGGRGRSAPSVVGDLRAPPSSQPPSHTNPSIALDASKLPSASKLVATSFDFKRLIKMSTFGLFVHGPACHHLISLLEYIWPGKSALMVTSKILFDQIVWNPIFTGIKAWVICHRCFHHALF